MTILLFSIAIGFALAGVIIAKPSVERMLYSFCLLILSMLCLILTVISVFVK